MEWLSTEQEFMHKSAMIEAEKMDKEKLLEILQKVHKQYLIYHNLFSKMVIWCGRNQLMLPSFPELLNLSTPPASKDS